MMQRNAQLQRDAQQLQTKPKQRHADQPPEQLDKIGAIYLHYFTF